MAIHRQLPALQKLTSFAWKWHKGTQQMHRQNRGPKDLHRDRGLQWIPDFHLAHFSEVVFREATWLHEPSQTYTRTGIRRIWFVRPREAVQLRKPHPRKTHCLLYMLPACTAHREILIRLQGFLQQVRNHRERAHLTAQTIQESCRSSHICPERFWWQRRHI